MHILSRPEMKSFGLAREPCRFSPSRSGRPRQPAWRRGWFWPTPAMATRPASARGSAIWGSARGQAPWRPRPGAGAGGRPRPWAAARITGQDHRPGSPARITGQDHRPGSAKALAESLEASAWTTVTWREGSNAPPRLPPSRDALHRGLGLPDLRTADDSPSGPPAAAGRKAPSVPEGYRPRGAANPARTAQPDFDRHSATAPRDQHRKGPSCDVQAANAPRLRKSPSNRLGRSRPKPPRPSRPRSPARSAPGSSSSWRCSTRGAPARAGRAPSPGRSRR